MTPLQQELLIAVVKVLVIFHALLGLFSLMTYLERRMLAFMQFRLGPNRVGPLGLFQPIADGIKLFFKEEMMPAGATKWLFVAAPAVAVITAFLSMAVVPWGGPVTEQWKVRLKRLLSPCGAPGWSVTLARVTGHW